LKGQLSGPYLEKRNNIKICLKIRRKEEGAFIFTEESWIFYTLFTFPNSKSVGNTKSMNLNLLPSSGEGGETSSLMDF
jgi:hypothetical protein